MNCAHDPSQSISSHGERRTWLLGSLAVVLFTSLSAPASAQATCTRYKYDLPASYALQLTDSVSGSVLHLQRSNYQFKPTTLLWIQFNYHGQYYIPVDIFDIQVRLQGRYVYETFNGQVRQVYKQIPVVLACSNWRVVRY